MSARGGRSISSCARSPTAASRVLVLSSDVEEVAGISDRSIVLDRGRIVGRFEQGRQPAALMAATAADPAFHAA